MKHFHKSWVSPCLAVGFAIISITGLLLLFHVKNGVIMNLHEWVGLIFVCIGVVHLIINWKPFLTYFRKRPALVSIIAITAISVVISLSGDKKEEKYRHRHSTTIENSNRY